MFVVIKLLVVLGFIFKSVVCENLTVFDGSKLCNSIGKQYYDYDEFFALSDINDSQSAGYYVKIKISTITKYGTFFIILCENDELLGKNRCYEFGIWYNSYAEIRQKDSAHELSIYAERELVPYKMELDHFVFIELSVSNDGTIKLLDLKTQFEIHITDTSDVIPVKYIAFASLQGYDTWFRFNCSNVTDRQTEVFSRGFQLVSTWTIYITTVLALLRAYNLYEKLTKHNKI